MYTQNIKALRAVKGLRQEDLAKFLGISLNSYNNKENGKREFSLMEANSLAKLFGYSIEEIFFKKVLTKKYCLYYNIYINLKLTIKI